MASRSARASAVACVAAAVVGACATAAVVTPAVEASPSPRAVAAIVEWQFPTAPEVPVPVHPEQASLAAELAARGLAGAVYPGLSEESVGEVPRLLEKLEEHAARVARVYARGDASPDAGAFLVNIAPSTPEVLGLLVARGVRVIAFSSGSKTRLGGLEAFVAAHPEVLVLVAAPHISGNSLSIEDLDEVPSNLAARHSNVVLVGCVASPDPADPGEPLYVDNQPVSPTATGPGPREVFLEDCRRTYAYADGLGATSAAAPLVARRVVGLLAREAAAGRTVTPAALMDALVREGRTSVVREKSGRVHEATVFDLEALAR